MQDTANRPVPSLFSWSAEFVGIYWEKQTNKMLLFQFPSDFLSITLYSISSLPLGRSELVYSKCLDEEMDSFQFTLLSLLQRWMAVVFVPFDKNVQEMCRAHILCIRLKRGSEHKQRAEKFSLPSLSSSSLSPELQSLLARNKLRVSSHRQKAPVWSTSSILKCYHFKNQRTVSLILQLMWIKIFPLQVVTLNSNIIQSNVLTFPLISYTDGVFHTFAEETNMFMVDQVNFAHCL